MKRTLLVTPAAEAEIAAAAAWYYDIFATLATRFLDEVSVVLESITSTPTRYPLWPGLPLIRKARLNMFPYYAVFTTDDRMITYSRNGA